MVATTVKTGIRAASLDDLATLLMDQHARAVDVVVAADNLHAGNDGALRVDGLTEPVLTEDGVTLVDGLYVPTRLAMGQLGDALGVPTAYVRRLADVHPELWAENVNGWLAHEQYRDKKYLVRALKGDGGPGVARAFLSDRYKVIDNLDVLMAALDGLRDAGLNVTIPSADLTDSRMYVKIWAPQVAQAAERLLAGYRSPFDFGERRANDQRVWTEAGPVVFAGMVISNSEVGGGAFSIAPQVVYQICANGMTISRESLRKTHIGGKLEEGVIDWSELTQRKALELVRAQTTDAVRTFLSPEYLAGKVAELEAVAGAPVTDPAKTIEVVSKKLSYDKATAADLLRHFTLGGQLTAGGVANAITSLAQTLEDADKAHAMEADAVPAMELVAALS